MEEQADDDPIETAQQKEGSAEAAAAAGAFMSVARLQQLLESTDNIRNTLLSVDTNTAIHTERFPNWDGIGPRARHRYGTLLHAACHDRDGRRGEAKIRRILQTAEKHQDVCSDLLTVGEVWQEELAGPVGFHGMFFQNWDGKECAPLHALLENPNATLESIRLLCEASSSSSSAEVLYLRGPCDEEERNDNMVSKFLRTFANDPERLLAVCEILLQAAVKTRLGAKGFLSTACFQKTATLNVTYWRDGISYSNTPLEVALKRVADPHDLLRLFLQYWPDAFQSYCQDDSSRFSNELFSDFHPLTMVCHDLRFPMRSGRQLEMLQIFLQHSSVRALAHVLLRADNTGCSGFRALDRLLNPAYYPGQAVSNKDDDGHNDTMYKEVAHARDDLARRKDQHGRTILHYLSADVLVFPYEPIKDDVKRTLWLCRETLRLGRIETIVRWILTIDSNAFLVQDINGMTPFQYAISQGKGWETGLKSLLDSNLLSEEVLCGRTQEGLYPFMLAATVESYDHLGTIFELLRCNPELIHG